MLELNCLVFGENKDEVFPIRIKATDSIGILKKLIKEERPISLKDFDAPKLQLWKWNKSEEAKGSELDSRDKLGSMGEVGNIFPSDDPPLKKCIHIIIKGPEGDTAVISPQDLEEFHNLRRMFGNFKKPSQDFNLILHPKTKTSITWTVDMHTATLDMLSTRISTEYPEYKNSALLFIFKPKDDQTHTLHTDGQLQNLLCSLFSNNQMTVKVHVSTPAKPFSDWTLTQVMRLYEIGDPSNPHIKYFSQLKCNSTPIDNNGILPKLVGILEDFLLTTSLTGSNEATRSIFIYPFLNSVILDFVSGSESKFSLNPQHNIEGHHGKGPVDYAIEIAGSGWIVGITEVKRDDLNKGVAQNAVQIESVLWNRKRKANQISKDDVTEADGVSEEADSVSAEVPILRCFGIITDAKDWMFLECTYVAGKPKFQLSRVYSIRYGTPSMKDDIHEILRVIKWLLTEAAAAANAAAPDPRKKAKMYSTGINCR